MKHVVQFSGGKDSTCMLLMMLEKGMPVDDIIFCDTGMEFPQMYEHIEQVRKYISKYGKDITFIKPKHSYEYYMYEVKKTRGKWVMNPGYGWAMPKNRWCTRLLKQEPTKEWKTKEWIEYIGIAADEPKRHERIPENTRHPLFDWGITEKMALSFCKKHGFTWGGLYDEFDRVSCWCCPLQSLKSLRILYHKHPDLWKKLKIMDEKALNQFRVDYSVQDLEEKFKREDYLKKISIPLFDVTKYLK